MGNPPSTGGLKGQWGVSNPTSTPAVNNPNTQSSKDTGSDKQAQDFQAAFQAE